MSDLILVSFPTDQGFEGTHAGTAGSLRNTSGLTKSAEPTNERFVLSSNQTVRPTLSTQMRILTRSFIVVDQLRRAKVGNLDPHILVEQNAALISISSAVHQKADTLLRLQVPMYHSPPMHEFDSVDQLSRIEPC